MRLKPVLDGDDGGETLIELLVAVIILGLTVVALVGGLTTSILLSGAHRKQALAALQAQAFGEAVQGFVLNNSGYQECAPAAYYDVYNPSGYTTDALSIAYWIPAAPFTPAQLPITGPSPAPTSAGAFGDLAACQNFRNAVSPPRLDGGVQRLSVRVTVAGSNVAQDLDVYIRRPCRPGDPLCD
jgi:type II secretory pathway pseudopilin PulG